jgi:hypothetical protein
MEEQIVHAASWHSPLRPGEKAIPGEAQCNERPGDLDDDQGQPPWRYARALGQHHAVPQKIRQLQPEQDEDQSIQEEDDHRPYRAGMEAHRALPLAQQAGNPDGDAGADRS